MTRMAWKIERWSETVFPGEEKIWEKYQDLEPYTLVILSASTIDLALVEMIAARIRHDEKEQETFLGLNEDGRAPCGSFGARIQLAYLLGLISRLDKDVFRHLKRLRNILAHRANIDFRDRSIRSCIEGIYDAFGRKLREEGGQPEGEISFFPSYFRDQALCTDAILGTVLAIYQIHMRSELSKITRIV